MMQYILCGMIVLLVLCGIVQEILHRAERKDLYSRLMAKTLSEYKSEGTLSVRSKYESIMKAWRGKGGGKT